MPNTIKINSEALSQARDLYSVHEKKLERYIDKLLSWNKKINLVSRTVSRETIREHIVHSLLPIPLGFLEKHGKWIDSGTGGGLPGIPLAICGREKTWQLNDNVRKKVKAVGDIVHSLQLYNVEVIAKSISLVDLQKGTGIVTKHAFKIPDLLRLLRDKPWETILMWKGIKDVDKEIHQYRGELNLTICEFRFGNEEAFYEGKGLVMIER